MGKAKLSMFSVTEASDFQMCRRYWYWANYGSGDGSGGFQSKKPAIPLWLGSGVHRGLEAYFHSDRDPVRCIGVFDDWYTDFAKKMQEEYRWVWVSLEREAYAMYQLGRGMLTNFCEFDRSGQSRLHGEIYKVERRIRLPVLDPKTGRPTRTIISGKIDLVLKRHDGFWIVDHKTYNRKPEFNALDIDDQMTGYAYLFWRDREINPDGEVPAGIIYNCLIKAIPAPPERLKRGGFSRAKSQLTTYEMYRRTLEEAGETISSYADVLNALAVAGWNEFFAQDETFRNEDELRAYGERTYYRSRDMASVLCDPEHLAYPMPQARGNCGWCQFREACKNKDDGGDWESIMNSVCVKRQWGDY